MSLRSVFARTTALAVGLSAAVAAGPAGAQVLDSVDQSLLETWRLQRGDVIRFCHYGEVATRAFDVAVAEELAARLFLESSITALSNAYAIGGEYAAEDLYVTMTNDCDVMLGMGLAANAYPQEFTVTRPYAGFAYVLVVDTPEYTRISDIPGTLRLGAPVGSYGLREILRYTATRPADSRWQTLPYGDPELMLTRLRDDTIAGMVMYGPSYVELIGDAAADDLTVLSLEPDVQARIDIGGVLLARNSFLRELMDDAIADMVADGTIDRFVEESGLGGIPFQAGGYAQ